MTDTRRYFHWDKQALLSECIKLANKTAELQTKADHLQQQAEIWKQEARTQASIVKECYQAISGCTGEPGDWNGAKPVKDRILELQTWERLIRYLINNHEGEPIDETGFQIALSSMLAQEEKAV